jgi:hypothetical protein
MANRGQLTDAIQAKCLAFLGREIDRTEYRLYPYLLYVMVNERRLEPVRVNQSERDVLTKLRAEGHIEGGASGLAMTREFFLFASDAVFDGYAAYDNMPADQVSV